MKTPYLLLFALSSIIPGLVIALTNNITVDYSALNDLKSQLSLDPSHTLSLNWSDSTSVCSWIGVTCGSHHHERVTGLDLSSMNLTTSLPRHIGNLSFLVSLNLSHNNFYGNIPQELSHLRRLRILDISFNALSGEIPSPFSFLTELEMLYLSNNSLTGGIPLLSNMSNIEALDLSYNALQGGIPKDMGDLVNLKILHLGYNQLSGYIPSKLFNISTIETLILVANRFSGKLPENMCGGLSMLEELRLGGNVLSGEIQTNMSTCSRLRTLSLAYNHFNGSIPRNIGDLRRSEFLILGGNNLTGELPKELSNMTRLSVLDLSDNQLTGSITIEALNISSLQYLNLGLNNLFGILPADIWSHFKLLEVAYLNDNKLTGVIPHYEIEKLFNLDTFSLAANDMSGSIPLSLFNVSSMRILSLSDNHLVGNLPPDLGLALPNLEVLELHNNSLSSSSVELSFIASLTNCRNLRRLAIAQNPLNGVLLSSIGNFSTSLQYLYVYESGIRGRIPDEIGNLSNLIDLSLWGNNISGTLPRTLVNIQGLQGLDLSVNKISGTIPSNICELENLIKCYLSDNEIYGAIPPCIGNITSLSTLDLSINNLNGTIPTSLWNIHDILNLYLSSNSLTGNVPVEIGNLRSVNVIDFSLNQLSGTIPTTIGALQLLVALSLSNNILNGDIPATIAGIVNLESLDLSHNNLSGGIPALMENLVHLNYLNVSFNGLSGEIPSGGPFENFTSQSFMFNLGLCGDRRYNVTPCQDPKVVKENGKRKTRVIFIILGASVFLILMGLAYGFVRAKKRNKPLSRSNIWVIPTQMRISYYELLDATDMYSESHLIDSGSFGSVYRGNLKNGKCVAIKVFHAQREGAFDSFEVECEMLRKLRHRNLCKVIGCCSNGDFKALILEYMPNGSLENNLYSMDLSLALVQRISIMVDVASALEYLHYGHSSPIVHCDLKPSNILLDENMVGRLCDFGLAKLLGGGEFATQTMTLATLGYIAPEFGTDGRVSIQIDIYSYGITLMEVFTGKKPNGEFFTGDLSLRSWVEDALMYGAIEHIIDPNIIRVQEEEEEKHLNLKLTCVRSIMELALRCTCESPRDRINIKDVNASLKKIRSQLAPLRSQ